MSIYIGNQAIENTSEKMNLLHNSKGPFVPDNIKISNYDNYIIYRNSPIFLEQGKTYTIFAASNRIFTNNHQGEVESDNVTLWAINGDQSLNQIISDENTGSTGTTFTFKKQTGVYYIRVNCYHRDTTGKVEDIKIVEGKSQNPLWTPNITDLVN